MREIKFRCWDKENKEMLDVEYLHWDDCTREFSIRTTMYSDYFGPSDMILMQYVGLKDKNGKEIYEGDIVKGTFYGFPMPEYDYIFQIYWDEKEKGFMANYFEPSECEVIGNVWEDSDLLNDSKNTKSN